MATGADQEQRSTIDGRRARRERGRRSVTDAMIDLVFEGNVPPNVEQVAERAGVSVASIFRYFDTLDDLRRATTDLYFERYADLFDIPAIGEGSLADRINAFVTSRVTLHETVEPMARLARIRAPENTEVEGILHRTRATRADQIRQHFNEELQRLSPSTRDDTVAVLATLTSFEAWDQFRHHHRRSQAQIRRAWSATFTKVLSQ